MMEGVDLGKDITSRGTWLTWIFTGNRKSSGYSSHGLPHGVSKEVGSRIPFLLKEPIVLSLVKPNKKGPQYASQSCGNTFERTSET